MDTKVDLIKMYLMLDLELRAKRLQWRSGSCGIAVTLQTLPGQSGIATRHKKGGKGAI
jgi:hypothetical protein